MLTHQKFSNRWDSAGKQELWQSFTGGNREALSKLFLRIYEKLFRYGMHFTENQETAKDSIQELFLRLWKKRESLEQPHSVEAYLYASLRRIQLRKNKRRAARQDRNAAFVEEEVSKMYSIEQILIDRENEYERQEIFNRALKVLTPRQKEALLLRIDSGMGNKEIGCIMDISDKRVRNLIYEATKRLKEEVVKLVQ